MAHTIAAPNEAFHLRIVLAAGVSVAWAYFVSRAIAQTPTYAQPATSFIPTALALLLTPAMVPIWTIVSYLRRRLEAVFWLRQAVQVHAALAFVGLFVGFPGLIGPAFPDSTIFFLAFVAWFADVILLILLPTSPHQASWPWVARSIGLATMGFATLALVFWSFANIGLVTWRASAVADGRPSCLMVHHGHYYRPVTSLLDLNGFALHSPYLIGGSQDYQFTFHAVLVVGTGASPELHNWSFRSFDFVPIRGMAESLAPSGDLLCTPRKH